MDLHIDMSGKYSIDSPIGIACLCTENNIHYGLALKKRRIDSMQKELGVCEKDYTLLHAILISILLHKFDLFFISNVYICNDEPFESVKNYLSQIINLDVSKIKSITDYKKGKKVIGCKIRSPADSYATKYRKRALNPKKSHKGLKLNVVEVSMNMVISLLKLCENPNK